MDECPKAGLIETLVLAWSVGIDVSKVHSKQLKPQEWQIVYINSFHVQSAKSRNYFVTVIYSLEWRLLHLSHSSLRSGIHDVWAMLVLMTIWRASP